MCLGERIRFASNVYYLFTTAVIKTFKLLPVADKPVPTVEPIPGGFTLGYQGFETVLIPRNQ